MMDFGLNLMSAEDKLRLALQKLEELSNLIVDNEYELFLSQHIIPIQIEIERQLSHY